jgi:hypothetical protein
MNDLIESLLQYNAAIAAVVLTGAFGAHLVWRNNRKSRYAAACEKFRTNVLSVLIGLYPSPSNWPERKLAIIEELESRFPALQVAVSEFRHQLPFWRRLLFDRAWRTYRLGKDGRALDGQYYWQYVPHNGEGITNGKRFSYDNRLTYQENFKRNVTRLLSYARET